MVSGARARVLAAAVALTATLLIAVGGIPGTRAFAAPVQRNVPTPEEFFGVRIGDPGVLIKHSRILEYYRELERTSDRVSVHVVGESTEGRPIYYAIVTSPDNHARLDELMAMNDKLYDPRGVSEEEAQRIVRDGKTFVIANHQIHSTEVGASQGAILLAYRLAAGNDPEVQRILDDVVLVHVPVHNPDGQEMVYDWLAEHRGTPYENSSPPFLYQKYTGHDNNRDWYMFTQLETRRSIEMQNRFHPQFTLDQHQMGSNGGRIFVPPFEDPWEPGVDGALIASNNLIGTFIGQYLTSKGYAGVEWKERYDAWTPARAYYHYHGGVRILTEVASSNYADAIEIPFDRIQEDYQRTRWSFPMPWPGGTWSFADVVDYHYQSSVAAMVAAADLGEQLRRGMYAAQRRSVEPPPGSPYAFVFPAEQVDPPTAYRLLDVLGIADVEVERAAADFTAGGRTYRAGSHVVRFAQPAGRFAKTVLERQDYPQLYLYEGGPLDPPYDVTAHTLPLLMNVQVDFIDQPFDAALASVDEIGLPPGAVVTAGVNRPGQAIPAAYLLDARVNNSYSAAMQLWDEGLTRATAPFQAGGRSWPAGTFVIPLTPPLVSEGEALEIGQEVGSLAQRYGIEVIAVNEPVEAPLALVGQPRAAIYQSYSPSMPEGWFRWMLDAYDVPFDVLHAEDIAAGGLQRYGVLFLPPGGGSPRQMVEGRGGGGRGGRGGRVPPEYAAGIGESGVQAIRDFVDEGGVLFTWADSWRFLTEYLGVEAAAVNEGLAQTEFNIPGSILRVEVDTDNPLAYGLPEETPIFFRNDEAFSPGTAGSNVVARYPDQDLLLSGWIQGERYLAGQAAMLEIPRGRGRMVIAGFYPEYRGQAHLTLKMMFNALFYPRGEAGPR
jgi:hypothetical protein